MGKTFKKSKSGTPKNKRRNQCLKDSGIEREPCFHPFVLEAQYWTVIEAHCK